MDAFVVLKKSSTQTAKGGKQESKSSQNRYTPYPKDASGHKRAARWVSLVAQ